MQDVRPAWRSTRYLQHTNKLHFPFSIALTLPSLGSQDPAITIGTLPDILPDASATVGTQHESTAETAGATTGAAEVTASTAVASSRTSKSPAPVVREGRVSLISVEQVGGEGEEVQIIYRNICQTAYHQGRQLCPQPRLK